MSFTNFDYLTRYQVQEISKKFNTIHTSSTGVNILNKAQISDSKRSPRAKPVAQAADVKKSTINSRSASLQPKKRPNGTVERFKQYLNTIKTLDSYISQLQQLTKKQGEIPETFKEKRDALIQKLRNAECKVNAAKTTQKPSVVRKIQPTLAETLRFIHSHPRNQDVPIQPEASNRLPLLMIDNMDDLLVVPLPEPTYWLQSCAPIKEMEVKIPEGCHTEAIAWQIPIAGLKKWMERPLWERGDFSFREFVKTYTKKNKLKEPITLNNLFANFRILKAIYLISELLRNKNLPQDLQRQLKAEYNSLIYHTGTRNSDISFALQKAHALITKVLNHFEKPLTYIQKAAFSEKIFRLFNKRVPTLYNLDDQSSQKESIKRKDTVRNHDHLKIQKRPKITTPLVSTAHLNNDTVNTPDSENEEIHNNSVVIRLQRVLFEENEILSPIEETPQQTNQIEQRQSTLLTTTSSFPLSLRRRLVDAWNADAANPANQLVIIPDIDDETNHSSVEKENPFSAFLLWEE